VASAAALFLPGVRRAAGTASLAAEPADLADLASASGQALNPVTAPA
jgi:hypothetical protein